MPDRPYDELPLLPPAIELETKFVLKQCITARSAHAELKRAGELLLNQGVLINVLPLLEAQASSEIEDIVTTTDRLFSFRAIDDQADPATKEAPRSGSALREGFLSLQERPLPPARRTKSAPGSGAWKCRCCGNQGDPQRASGLTFCRRPHPGA